MYDMKVVIYRKFSENVVKCRKCSKCMFQGVEAKVHYKLKYLKLYIKIP